MGSAPSSLEDCLFELGAEAFNGNLDIRRSRQDKSKSQRGLKACCGWLSVERLSHWEEDEIMDVFCLNTIKHLEMDRMLDGMGAWYRPPCKEDASTSLESLGKCKWNNAGSSTFSSVIFTPHRGQ